MCFKLLDTGVWGFGGLWVLGLALSLKLEMKKKGKGNRKWKKKVFCGKFS
jgi:hypothetical protein